MDLNFLKAQLVLELEEDFQLEEIFLILIKIVKACGKDFVMKDYLLNHRRDPQSELYLALFTDSQLCHLRYKNGTLGLSTMGLSELQKTHFSVHKSRASLTILGPQKFVLSNQMPDSPKKLLDFQKSLEAQMILSAEALTT